MATAATDRRIGQTSAPLKVTEVSSRRQREEFIRLPWTIYASDPHWVPPLLAERREFIDPRRHPFYLHGSATLLLAHRNGQCVGRILVSDDPNYNQLHQTNTGCFGMFESIDDAEVALALLQAAERWLAARGRTQLMGPIDYSTNYTCGLLVDGFNTPPRIMMGHNPAYYQPLLEQCGLTKAKDLYAWWFNDRDDLAEKWSRLANSIERRGRVSIRKVDMKRLDEEIAAVHRLYNEAWESNWGFVPMTDAEFTHLAKPLRWLVPPEYLTLAEIDGQIVGFSMCLPDFNEAFRPLNGRLFRWGLPIGLLDFYFRQRRRIKTLRLVTLGVLQEYRRRGVQELLILRVLKAGKAAGLTGAELSWTLEDNEHINHSIRDAGASHYKTYRIYSKLIG